MPDGFLDGVRERLTPADDRVTAVAVVLAFPAAYLATHRAGEFVPGFLLLVLVGATVPQVYEDHWDRRYEGAGAAVAWTVAACTLTVAVFFGLYELVGVAFRQFGADPGEIRPAVAWVGTWALAVEAARTVAARRD